MNNNFDHIIDSLPNESEPKPKNTIFPFEKNINNDNLDSLLEKIKPDSAIPKKEIQNNNLSLDELLLGLKTKPTESKPIAKSEQTKQELTNPNTITNFDNLIQGVEIETKQKENLEKNLQELEAKVKKENLQELQRLREENENMYLSEGCKSLLSKFTKLDSEVQTYIKKFYPDLFNQSFFASKLNLESVNKLDNAQLAKMFIMVSNAFPDSIF